MDPITHESFLALGLAVVASFIFGFLWYGPLFGKTWAGLMGFKMDSQKCGKPPLSSLLLTILGAFFTTFAMAYILNIYHALYNFGAAALVWLGFYVPVQFGSVTWERKPWKLFALNTIYTFFNLQLIGVILTFVK